MKDESRDLARPCSQSSAEKWLFPRPLACREAAGRPSSAFPRAPVETNCCDRHTPPSLSAEAGPRHLPGAQEDWGLQSRGPRGGGQDTEQGWGPSPGDRFVPLRSSSSPCPAACGNLLEPSTVSPLQGPGCVCEMRGRTAQGVCARSCFAQPAPDFHLLTGMMLRACECRVARADMPEMACKKALPAKVKRRR